MPSKSSPLDVVPTLLLKACLDVFSDIIANLANLTFHHGYFPARYRMAQQHRLDATDPSSYRPISNLSTISKVLERLVLTRLTSHLGSST